jgi:hypothetical protein
MMRRIVSCETPHAAAPPHDVLLSASVQQEYRSSGVLALVAVCQPSEDGWRHVLHRERARLVPRDTVGQQVQGRGIKLVTEEPTPVSTGSVPRTFPRLLLSLGNVFFIFPCSQGSGLCLTHARGTRLVGSRASCLAESATKQARKAALPTRESSSLLLMHSPVLLAEERMSQVASTALER